MKRTKKGLKSIKADCYYLYSNWRSEFIIYIKSVKAVKTEKETRWYADRKIWNFGMPYAEGSMEYCTGGIIMSGLRRIPEKAALLKIAAWML